MDGTILDSLFGKLYDLPVFENDLVKIESGEDHIKVGIKHDGVVCSCCEFRHPFSVENPNPLPKNGWDFRIEAPGINIATARFSNQEETHILTLVCKKPDLQPKPIEVYWFSRKNRE